MLGGGVGALSRYGVTLLSARWFGIGFPWGTYIANMAGCFFIGVMFALTDRSGYLSPEIRLFVMTGFLGALTTFSTYSLETIIALRTGSGLVAVVNLLANNVGGLCLTLAGIWITSLLLNVK